MLPRSSPPVCVFVGGREGQRLREETPPLEAVVVLRGRDEAALIRAAAVDKAGTRCKDMKGGENQLP